MKKIIISKPYILKFNTFARLEAKISIEQKYFNLYFEVEKQYEQYLTYEVSDSFLVCLLLYAMQHEFDLEFEGSLSETLYVQITNYLLPAISNNVKLYKPINIVCNQLISPNFNPHITATGISCGVDSFYTVLKNLNHSEESGLKLNALTFFNAGASGSYGGETARDLYKDRASLAQLAANELNLPIITVDSNMNEFLQQDHEATHVFRTLSIPLALQKLFKVYYFSSTFNYNQFKFCDFDPSYYDCLSLPLISTSNTKFILVGGETTRMGKISFISNNDTVKNQTAINAQNV